MTAEKIKIVVVDDNEEIRFIIREIISEEADIVFVGEASNIQEGKQRVLTDQPDVALIDLSLDEPQGGLKILEEIKKSGLPIKTIIITAHNEFFAPICFAQGAHGYISKDKVVSDLSSAIRQVYEGGMYVP